jgi:hypothetical protein
MRNIQETMGNTIKYRVSFIELKSDGVPIEAEISVKRGDTSEFEDYLNKKNGEIFEHADGGNVSY